jgi:polysaccharide chain length determinant protein (PEP-CTERM system associated)
MDKVYLNDLKTAIKSELIRFRGLFVTLFIVFSFVVLVLGAVWPKTYSTNAMLVADVTHIIEPLLKGQAEVSKIDRSEQAKEFIYARAIMETVAKERGLITKDSSPEQIVKTVEGIKAGLVIKKENNNYFRLAYESNDPDRSFEMLNTIINVFMADTEKKKRDESQGAYNFIDAQVQSYKHQLELAEVKLKEFNSKNVDGNETSVAARISQLRIDIESLKIAIEESQARVNTLQQQLGAEGQYQHAKGQVDELKTRRQMLNTELARMRLSYEDSYPDIVSLRSQIAELDSSINKLKGSGDSFNNNEKVENPLYEELRKQLSVAEVDLRAQKRRMESLVNLQEQEHERAQRVASNQAEFSELTRDYDVTKKQYEEMLLRKGQARLSMTLDVEGQGISYRIQEPATFPIKPSGLSFLHFAIAGPWVGLLLPLILLFAFVSVDPHIRSARALQNMLPPDVEMLGVIPHYHSPIGDRLLKRDMVVLVTVSILSLVAYIACAIYWQLNIA